MAELRPCPNPECRGLGRVNTIECVEFGAAFQCECAWCGYRGPAARNDEMPWLAKAEAVRLHNALPREERWVPVEEGLPEPDTGEEFELFIPEETVLVGCVRTEYWDGELVWERPSCAFPVRGVTHWRPHTPPRGPEVTDD